MEILNSSDLIEIEEFFSNDELAKLFADLYNYALSLCPNLRFCSRGSIIGFACEGEHFRAYIKQCDDLFFIKFKTRPDPLQFCKLNYSLILRIAKENNDNFNDNIEEYTLKKTPDRKISPKKRHKIKEKPPIQSWQDPILAKLMNNNDAKTFSESYFDKIANWTYGESFFADPIIIDLPDGNQIECDSQSEVILIKYLISKGLVKKIAGQNLLIKYSTAFSKNCRYYPDIVLLTNDNHVAIIEVKPVTAMSYHKNMEKYAALQDYCKKNGYAYMMIDPADNFITYDDILCTPIPKEIKDRLYSYLELLLGKSKTCLLEKEDISMLYEEFSKKYTKGTFEKYIHYMIIQNNWYNKFTNGFLVFEKPQKELFEIQ